MAESGTVAVKLGVDINIDTERLREQARLLNVLADKVEEAREPDEFALACDEPKRTNPFTPKVKLRKLEIERDEIGRQMYLLDVDRRRLMDRLDALTAEIEVTRMALEGESPS